MKKSDLTVGMTVENAYGRVGTVTAIGDKKKVSVLWTRRDGTPYVSADTERVAGLYPVGTYEALRVAQIWAHTYAAYQS